MRNKDRHDNKSWCQSTLMVGKCWKYWTFLVISRLHYYPLTDHIHRVQHIPEQCTYTDLELVSSVTFSSFAKNCLSKGTLGWPDSVKNKQGWVFLNLLYNSTIYISTTDVEIILWTRCENQTWTGRIQKAQHARTHISSVHTAVWLLPDRALSCAT